MKIDRSGRAGFDLSQNCIHGTIDQRCADDGNGGHAAQQGKRAAAGHFVSHGIALEV